MRTTGRSTGARVARLLPRAALLALGACHGSPTLTKLFGTEHVDYYAEEGAGPVCDATAAWIERYYAANARFFGASLPPGEKIEYDFVASGESLEQLGCPSFAGGCADGTTIHSRRALDPHEVVHANAYLLGNPPLLFQEGIAEVLSCAAGGDVNGPLDASAGIEALVETAAMVDWREAHRDSPYAASASFVRYLIDRFGAARFVSFYARAPLWGSREEIDGVFQAELGAGLDGAFSDWRSKPPLFRSDLCLRLMECDPTRPALVDADLTLGCGPAGYAGSNDEVLRFEVPEGRIVHVTTAPAPADPQVIPAIGFYRCSGGDAIGWAGLTAGYQVDKDVHLHIDPAQPGSAFALDVAPGPYVAWISAFGDARIHLDVEERQSPMRTDPCQPADEPLALDDQHQTTLATRWRDRPCQGPWCPGQGWDVSIGPTGGALEVQQSMFGGEMSQLAPAELYICPDACPADASACEILTFDPQQRYVRSKQTFAPGAVLHLGAPAAPYADHFALLLRVAPQ